MIEKIKTIKKIKPMGVYLKRLEQHFGRTKGGRRDEPDIITSIVGKQHNILL